MVCRTIGKDTCFQLFQIFLKQLKIEFRLFVLFPLPPPNYKERGTNNLVI